MSAQKKNASDGSTTDGAASPAVADADIAALPNSSVTKEGGQPGVSAATTEVGGNGIHYI